MSAASEAQAAADVPAPATGRAATLHFEEVSVGDALPELVVPLTRTLIVSTAIASRDYQDVHHDSVLAVERGSKDIFMNILSTNGIVGRFVTDWSGPAGVLTDVRIRLGAPNYPDDTMTVTGSVAAKDESVGSDGYGAVEVTIRGANSLGDHVTGTVGLRLPSRSGATGPAGSGTHPAASGTRPAASGTHPAASGTRPAASDTTGLAPNGGRGR